MRAPINIPTWTDLEAAYIAGLVDGEGYIGITRHKRNDPVIHVQAKLTVTNTHKKTIQWLAVMFGYGKGQIQRYTASGHRVWYSVDATGQRAALILNKIKIYLKIKCLQAELLLKYYEWQHNRGPSRWRPLQKADSDYLRSMIVESRRLNHSKYRNLAKSI